MVLERRVAPWRLVILSIHFDVDRFYEVHRVRRSTAVLVGLVWAYRVRLIVSREQLWLSILAALSLPLLILVGYMASNVRHYHTRCLGT